MFERFTIRTELNLPRPRPVVVKADDAYRTSARYSDDSPTVGLGSVADLLREGLLDTFPAMLEATVTISDAPEPPDLRAPTFSVSATSKR